jgi:cell division control protein 6
MLWNELDDCGGTVLVVLDEVDHVEDDSILYQLPRARANDNLSEAKIGIIGISNDFSFREDLSPKVRSSLCEQEIHFPAYDASDLQMILEQRVSVAYHEDVLEPGVIPLCAAYGAKDAGDARQSIDLLMKAGDLARDEDTQTVTEDHVERGRRELERGRIKEGITGLTQHGHLVLYALLTLDLEGEAPVRSRDVRPRYTRFTEMADRDPLVPRRMRDHLSELAMLGIISVTERNEGRRGGTYREYAIDMDVDLLLDAIEDTVREVGIHQSVKRFLVDDELDHGDTELSDFAPESR